MSNAEYYHSDLYTKKFTNSIASISSLNNERKLLKVFLISYLYKLFYGLFHNKFERDFVESFDFTMECYTVDRKIIQFLIHEIIETEEYTLEGLASYTRIPFDIIFDAACGNNIQLSITVWARIVDLYLQVKPEISKYFFDKLIEAKHKHHYCFSLLLNTK